MSEVRSRKKRSGAEDSVRSHQRTRQGRRQAQQTKQEGQQSRWDDRGVSLPAKDPALPIRIVRGDAIPALVKPDEVDAILTADEVARLKLVILTSTDANEKIEAIRKLIYSGLGGQEKGLLFIRALGDDSPLVRREAAIGLKTLGLDPHIAEVIKDLSSGSQKQKEFAVSSLTKIVSEGSDVEKAVVLSVLTGALRTEEDVNLKKEILRIIELFAPMMALRKDLLSDLHHLLLDELVSHFDALSDGIKRVYRTLGAHGAEALSNILWAEIEKVEDRKIRAHILMVLTNLALSEDEKRRVARAVVREISNWSDLDIDCRRLANTLKPLGSYALDGLLDAFDAVGESQKVFFVKLLDGIAAGEEVSAAERNRVAELLAKAFKTGKRPLRMTILETCLCYHSDIKPHLKRQMASDFLSALHEFRLERVHDLTDMVLRKMGLEVIDAIISVVKETPYEVEKLAGVRAIAEILAEADGDSKSTKDVKKGLDFLLKLTEEDFPSIGRLAVAIGRACSGRAVPTEKIEQIVRDFKSKLGRTSYTFDIIEALGWMAKSPHMSPALRFDIAGIFLGLLDQEYPDVFSRERKTDGAATLEIGQQVAIYTVLIPNIVKGLERVCSVSDVSESLLEKVVMELLTTWSDVISMKRVWGPASVTSLAESLGYIGTCEHVPPYLKIRILEALRLRITNMSVARWIGMILGAPVESPKMDELAASIAQELMQMSEQDDFSEPEDQEVIMGALGKIALRRRLGKGDKEAEILRTQMVEVLFTGLRNDTVGVRRALVLIRDSEHLPRSLRKKVAERLARE